MYWEPQQVIHSGNRITVARGADGAHEYNITLGICRVLLAADGWKATLPTAGATRYENWRYICFFVFSSIEPKLIIVPEAEGQANARCALGFGRERGRGGDGRHGR